MDNRQWGIHLMTLSARASSTESRFNFRFRIAD
jgi:hypothetical protein